MSVYTLSNWAILPLALQEVRVRQHVDIVLNDWKRRVQFRVAVVWELGGYVKVEPLMDGWDNTIPNWVRDSAGDLVSIDGEPDRYFAALPAALDMRDLFATPIHDEDSCSFVGGDVVLPMVETPYDNEANERALEEARTRATG